MNAPLVSAARLASAAPYAGPPVLKQMPSGRMVDLMRLAPQEVDWAGDVAPALAEIARFDGAAGGWSVLDHLITGFDLLSFAGLEAQGLWLLHDVHEAYLGDISTPARDMVAACADAEFEGKPGYAPGWMVKAAVKAAKARLDGPIFAAAQAPPLAGHPMAALIHRHDLQMMRLERDSLMAAPQQGWGELERLPRLAWPKKWGRMKPLPKSEAIARFLTRLDRAWPHARAAWAACQEEMA